MSITEDRIKLTGNVADAALNTDDIRLVMSAGDEALAPADLRIIAVTKEEASVKDAYQSLNYYIMTDIVPESGKGISRDDSVIVKEYTFTDGLKLTLRVCSADSIGESKWHRVIFDDDELAASIAGAVDEDDLLDESEIPPAEPDDGFDDIEDEPEGITVVEVPVEEPEPEPEPEPEAPEAPEKTEEEKYWEYVSDKIKIAHHAIQSGSLIRANEVVCLLRRMLIELICVHHGITDNFEHSIDFIECEEKEMLMRTYPSGIDSSSMAIALGAISELFDRLS